VYAAGLVRRCRTSSKGFLTTRLHGFKLKGVKAKKLYTHCHILIFTNGIKKEEG
jgi:hypothetical protein